VCTCMCFLCVVSGVGCVPLGIWYGAWVCRRVCVWVGVCLFVDVCVGEDVCMRLVGVGWCYCYGVWWVLGGVIAMCTLCWGWGCLLVSGGMCVGVRGCWGWEICSEDWSCVCMGLCVPVGV